MTGGEFHNYTYEEAAEWVHGCMRDDPTYKFWAICKNDETRDIVGWCSVSEIDYEKKSACGHGIVIGNPEYRDGFTWIEAALNSLNYVFNILEFDKIYTCFVANYYVSHLYLQFMKIDKVKKHARYKKGHYYDVIYVSMTRDEYFSHPDLEKEVTRAIHHFVQEIRLEKSRIEC